VKKTYFGLAAMLAGGICTLSLFAHYGVSQWSISQETFDMLNNLTALTYCVSTQAALALGIFGLTRKNDSKRLAWAGIVLAFIPFLFVFGQFLLSILG
jgi:hypothetical protein